MYQKKVVKLDVRADQNNVATLSLPFDAKIGVPSSGWSLLLTTFDSSLPHTPHTNTPCSGSRDDNHSQQRKSHVWIAMARSASRRHARNEDGVDKEGHVFGPKAYNTRKRFM